MPKPLAGIRVIELANFIAGPLCGTLLADMAKANAELKTFNQKSIYLSNLTGGVDLIRLANRFRTYAQSSQSEKEQQTMREVVASTFKNFDLGVEKQLLAALLLKNAELPAGQQVAAVNEIYGKKTGAKSVEEVRDFVTGTRGRRVFHHVVPSGRRSQNGCAS